MGNCWSPTNDAQKKNNNTERYPSSNMINTLNNSPLPVNQNKDYIPIIKKNEEVSEPENIQIPDNFDLLELLSNDKPSRKRLENLANGKEF